MKDSNLIASDKEPSTKHKDHSFRRKRVLLFSLLILAGWWLIAWVAAKALIVSADLPHADAMVVLSGSTLYQERTELASQLFREGRAAKIVLTNDNQPAGWSNELQRNPLFIEREADELRRAGVPADQIEMLPQTVSSTHDEALLLREYATRHGLHSLLIVTSAYHSRRALWTFRKVFEGSGVQLGLTIVPPGEQAPQPATWWLHLRGWREVAGEYPKLIYYWCAYR
jgi:uncharacterized SAM-binding protein YcdF (DUF218 family)